MEVGGAAGGLTVGSEDCAVPPSQLTKATPPIMSGMTLNKIWEPWANSSDRAVLEACKVLGRAIALEAPRLCWGTRLGWDARARRDPGDRVAGAGRSGCGLERGSAG